MRNLAGRILRVLSRSFVLLACLLVWPWIAALTDEVEPTPACQFQTNMAVMSGQTSWHESRWTIVMHVSDDGQHVILGEEITRNPKESFRLRNWNLGDQRDDSPVFWDDRDWLELFGSGQCDATGIREMLNHQKGREILFDRNAWEILESRMRGYREKAIQNLTISIRPDLRDRKKQLEEMRGSPLPTSIRFSPDGRHISYRSLNGTPVYVVSDTLNDGTIVEEFLTGKKIGYFPNAELLMHVNPQGVAALRQENGVIVQELHESTYFIDGWVAGSRSMRNTPDRMYESSSSRQNQYRFTIDSNLFKEGDDSQCTLSWQTLSQHKVVGRIRNVDDWLVVQAQKTVIIHPSIDHRNGGRYEPFRLQFWDLETGNLIEEWDLGQRADRGGQLSRFVGPARDRFIAAKDSPDYAVGRSPIGRIQDGIQSKFSADVDRDREFTRVFDLQERSQIRLPGWQANFSENGQWLATIDQKGTLRVWELPLSRPWTRIVVFALLASIATSALLAGAWKAFKYLGLARMSLAVFRWTTASRGRFVSSLTFVLLFGGFFFGLLIYSAAALRSRDKMEIAYDQIGRKMTEDDVTRLIGFPPEPGQSTGISGPFKGGGETSAIITNKRKWRRFGTEIEVHFGEDGRMKADYMTSETGTMDRIVSWVGW